MSDEKIEKILSKISRCGCNTSGHESQYCWAELNCRDMLYAISIIEKKNEEIADLMEKMNEEIERWKYISERYYQTAYKCMERLEKIPKEFGGEG